MTRKNADTFRCIVCGEETNNQIVCHGCTIKELKKQKEEPGSITVQQIYFMERKCLTKLDTQATYRIFLDVIPEYDYDIENLSCQQAKEIISKLLDAIPNEQ